MAAVAAALLAVSCNKEQNTPDEPQQTVAGEQITITASIPAEVSKVGLAYTGSALHPTWAAGDKIRVADHSDASNYQDFTLTDGEGTQSGTFTGTAVSASSYDITIVNATSWPANVLAQTQAADESTAHLGYTVALTGVNTYEDIAFTSTWASSKGGTIAQSGALHLRATLPAGVAAQVNNVTMVADKNIFGATGTMTIAITTPGDNGTANTLDVFASIPPTGVTIPSGTGILFKFGTTDADHSVYTRYYLTSSALNLAGGQLNLISLTGANTDKYAGKDDDGTAAHPYLIADKYQMAAMNTLMVADQTTYFKLVDDINLSGVSWTLLNNAEPYNKAVNFDGNGHTISNTTEPLFYDFNGSISNLTVSDANISKTSHNYATIARIVNTAGGSVTNVTVQNSSIAATGKNYAGAFFGTVFQPVAFTNCVAENVTITSGTKGGGLCGCIKAGSLTNCHTSGTVTTTSYYAGGLIGIMESGVSGDCTITNCYSTATVSSTGGTYSRVGGLIGQIERAVSIEKCYATGAVSGTGHFGGGLIGVVSATDKTVSISKCYATGSVTLPTSGNYSHAGGLLGSVAAGTANISNCYSTGAITIRRYSGGFVGTISASAGSLSISNSYTTSDISGIALADYCGLVLGNNSGTVNSCTGFIAWNTCDRPFCYPSEAISTTGNYYGTTGTVTSQAIALGWSSSIWDLTGSVPTLK